MTTTTQMTKQTRELVEQYIRYFGSDERSTSKLTALLDSQITFRGPLGKFESAQTFLEDVKQDKLLIETVRVHQIIADGTKASALYEVISKDPEIGTLNVSEWFETKDGRISSIISTYDASDVKAAHTRI
jgi:hypothetical protein